MRKLSCKWPVLLTIIAVALPTLYVLFRFGKPEIFSVQELAVKSVAAVVYTIIIWFVYGVACLLASPKGEDDSPPVDTNTQEGREMTEQKICKTCTFWHKEEGVKSGAGPMSPDCKFVEPEQEGGRCEKLNEAKSAYETCNDWEPKNSQ